MEYFFSILYVVSVCIWLIGFYKVKKTETKLNGFNFVPVTIFSLLCFQVLSAAILRLVRIEPSIISLGIINILSGLLLLFLMIRGYKQEYVYNKQDAVALIIMSSIIIVISTLQFNIGLNIFNYQCTWDSSVHLSWARKFASEHILDGMYFNALNMGLWLEVVYVFNPFATGCELYIYTDIITLILDVGLFWCLIRNYVNSKGMYFLGIIFTIAYVCGYPLNNMVFGTSYLGSGNLCVIFIMLIVQLCKEEKKINWMWAGMLIIAIFSMVKSYILFLPIILISLFVYSLVHLNEKNKITHSTLKAILGGTFVLGISGYIVVREWFWGAVSGLGLEGQIYRNLATNFIVFVPFILYALVKYYRNFSGIMLGVTLAYIVIFMLCVLSGRVSGYYYFKNYYVLWFLAFYNTFVIISENIKKQVCIRYYMFSCGLLALFSLLSVEDKLNEYSDPWYGQVFGNAYVSNLFDLYKYNYENMTREAVDQGTRDLFGEAARMNAYIDGDIFYVGTHDYAIHKVFYALANQPEIDTTDVDSAEGYVQKIRDTSKYVCVFDAESDSWDISEYLSTLEVVYQNDKGYIAKVQ